MSKKSFKNSSHIEGYLYEHQLKLKTTGSKSKNPGTEFISGKISIATDDEMLNVVEVHFIYVTPKTKKGTNPTYTTLQNIMDGSIPSVMEHGADKAGKLRIDTSIELNDWYDDETNQFVSTRRNEGGFVHQAKDLCDEDQRAVFDVDMVITGVKRVEANPDKETPEKVIIKGYIFNYRKEVYPIEFSVYEPYAPAAALNYFEDLGASSKSPVFTRLQGRQISRTIIRRKEEQSAFGDTLVKEYRSTQKDFVVTWASVDTYEWDSQETILASELAEMLAQREVTLAEKKKDREEYKKSKNAFDSVTAPVAPTNDEYDF